MSGAPLLFLAAAIAAEAEAKKRKELQIKQKSIALSQQQLYLYNQLAQVKTEDDFFALWDRLLNGKLSYYGKQQTWDSDLKRMKDGTGVCEVGVEDFISYLSLVMEPNEIARLFEKGNLVVKTAEHDKQYHSFQLYNLLETARLFRGAEIGSGVFLEKTLYQHRKEIFGAYISNQKRPPCPINNSYSAATLNDILFPSFLNTIKKYMHGNMLDALADDVVVPAMLMAAGETEKLKAWSSFVVKSNVSVVKIAETFRAAKIESEKPEYQDAIAPACPAAKTVKKWFGLKKKTVFDAKGFYACPLMESALKKWAKTKA